MNIKLTILFIFLNLSLYSQSIPDSIVEKNELAQGKIAYQRGAMMTAYNLFTKNKNSLFFDADCMAMLANIYLLGPNELKNCSLGLKYLDFAIAKESDRAKRVKAQLYQLGSCGFETNMAKAREWYLKASENNDPRSLYFLALFYQKDTSYTIDKVIELLKHAGELGESDAFNEIGRIYYNGFNVKQDYIAASEWYSKAALMGNFYAQANLGYLYYNGFGVPKDNDESLKWYRLAEEQEYVEAYFQIGWKYYHGHGVEQSYKQAISYFDKAAREGDSRAMLRLAFMYDDAEGVPRDTSKAIYWYKKVYAVNHSSDIKAKLEKLGVVLDEKPQANLVRKRKRKK